MSTEMERSLRTALEDLVDVTPPTGVAARAIRQAVRRDRLVKGGSAVAAVATVAFALAVVGAGGQLSRVDEVASPPVDDGSRVVQAYSGCRTEDDLVFSLVLNMSTGEYERLPYHVVLPSPDGTRLFAIGATGPEAGMMVILDRATGEVLVPGRDDGEPRFASLPAQWSDDGSTILLTRFGRDGQVAGFTLLDAATLQQTSAPPLAPPPGEVILAVSFTADGEGVMLVHGPIKRDNPFLAAGELTVTRYTLDGALVGSTPLGVDAFEAVVVSADRTEILVASPANSYHTIVSIAEASTTVIEAGAAGPPTWFDDRVVVFGAHGIIPRGTVLPVRLPVPAPPVADCTLYIDPVVGSGAGLPASADHLKLELFD